jgi:sec-independent protein translocase protein TatA
MCKCKLSGFWLLAILCYTLCSIVLVLLGGEMLRNIGPVELLVLAVIVVLIFGVGRVGELGGALGRSIREFRREVRNAGEDKPEEEKEEAKEEPKAKG